MDHYRTLQVSRHAEPEVIEKAYKALSMKYHPDRVPRGERGRAGERMRRINAAYEVLGHPSARVAYDRTLPLEHASGGQVSGWERFLEDGLVGLFVDWWRTQGGGAGRY
jgi:DnaJ-class molecular chaperone